MFFKVKQIEHDYVSFVQFLLLLSFPPLHITQKLCIMVCVNVRHTKQPLYYWRCSSSGSKVGVRYDWQPTPPNTYHGHFLIHNYAHILTTALKLWPPEIYQTCSMQLRSGRTGCGCGEFFISVCQEMCVAMYKMFAFSVLSRQPNLQMPYFKTCSL